MRESLPTLATAWLLEPDESALERLREISGLEAAADLTPEQAALEYSRVVLQLVPPYASLFLDESGMLNGPQAEQVELVYRRFGFEIASTWRAGPADHLGIELHFLAYLLEHGREAEAAAFLREYLLPWAPICLLAVERLESARLYPTLARVTRDLLTRLRADLS